MAVIDLVLGMVDDTVATVVSDSYAGVLAAVRPVVTGGSVLMLALVGANIATQTVALDGRNAVSVGLRIVLINIFLLYGNILVPYEALTNAPAQIGANMLGSLSGGLVTNLYSGLDDLYSRALDLGQAISQNGGWLAGAMTSVVLFIVAALMATVTIIILCASKLMLAVLLAIAPAIVATTLFRQTAPIFEAWVKMAIGFAVVPLLVAAMAGFTIATGQRVAPGDMASVESLGDALAFLVVMMLGTGLMLLVPGFAQSLAQTSLSIGQLGYAAAGYPGAMLRGGYGAARGLSAGVQGQSVSERASSPAILGNAVGQGGRATAGGISRAAQMAKKMKKG